ncbi:hypothetical protein HY310_00160 [Candidatus Microgenomates bacterium]|nr:hypothetical protein [Candidatus Microgenomates bacterium]
MVEGGDPTKTKKMETGIDITAQILAIGPVVTKRVTLTKIVELRARRRKKVGIESVRTGDTRRFVQSI